jgi:tRNA dimethylallyltransferase
MGVPSRNSTDERLEGRNELYHDSTGDEIVSSDYNHSGTKTFSTFILSPTTMFPFAETCWFLTGPTAGGKTAVGINLARKINGEIISLDSMAVYRGMDIGTAKPTQAERVTVPHHLIDVVEPHEEFSVAQYLDAAEKVVAEIRSRDKTPLFVGGTPMYLKALLRGIFQGPPADWNFRQQMEQFAVEHGPDKLHARLAQVDSLSAQKLLIQDQRRVIRALEVFEKTGKPLSEWQAQFDQGRPAAACKVVVLDWPREQLYDRINRRVNAMFAAGLVEETQRLLDGPSLSRTAAQAVGYREVLEHLSGVRDLSSTIELVKTRTRQFAKRQGTWFRGLSECRFISVQEPLDISGTVEQIVG